ncbi:hypothetical protein BO443_30549 [Burkholderia orbicola]
MILIPTRQAIERILDRMFSVTRLALFVLFQSLGFHGTRWAEIAQGALDPFVVVPTCSPRLVR